MHIMYKNLSMVQAYNNNQKHEACSFSPKNVHLSIYLDDMYSKEHPAVYYMQAGMERMNVSRKYDVKDGNKCSWQI